MPLAPFVSASAGCRRNRLARQAIISSTRGIRPRWTRTRCAGPASSGACSAKAKQASAKDRSALSEVVPSRRPTPADEGARSRSKGSLHRSPGLRSQRRRAPGPSHTKRSCDSAFWSFPMRRSRSCLRAGPVSRSFGFDFLFAPDHARHTGDPSIPWFDGLTVVAAMALRTNTIRIGTLVANPILRLPSALAKAAAAVDHLSGGK
jgi:hypothetical protein